VVGGGVGSMMPTEPTGRKEQREGEGEIEASRGSMREEANHDAIDADVASSYLSSLLRA
jgi:hypothetical protein